MKERRRLRSRRIAEIPTGSLADLAFLLIIFFMVTAVFASHKGLDAKLPDPEQAQDQEPEAVFFEALEDGSIRIDCQPAVREDILPSLAPRLERRPGKPIVIYSRPEAPYRTMVAIYDELMQAPLPVDEGGLGLPRRLNVSIPTYSQIREYEQIFGGNPFEASCRP
jgi:biopolymer transport protein ExbD